MLGVAARVELAVDVVGHIAGPDVGGIDDGGGGRDVGEDLYLLLLLLSGQVKSGGHAEGTSPAVALLFRLPGAVYCHVVEPWQWQRLILN